MGMTYTFLHDGRSVALEATPQPWLGIAIKSMRESHGWSLREFARRTGQSFNTLSRLEKGENVRYSVVVAALRVLREAMPVLRVAR